jgi:hypothetical protein
LSCGSSGSAKQGDAAWGVEDRRGGREDSYIGPHGKALSDITNGMVFIARVVSFTRIRKKLICQTLARQKCAHLAPKHIEMHTD